MRPHYYKDDHGCTAVIYKIGRGKLDPYKLVNFYTDMAIEYVCETLEYAEHLLMAAGGVWTEMPVKTGDEAFPEMPSASGRSEVA